jgi:hypothetical protein
MVSDLAQSKTLGNFDLVSRAPVLARMLKQGQCSTGDHARRGEARRRVPAINFSLLLRATPFLLFRPLRPPRTRPQVTDGTGAFPLAGNGGIG